MTRWIAMMMFAAATSAAAMTTPDYIAALDQLRTADATTARTRAKQLLGAEVDAPAGRFTADSALLHEVMANPVAARPHLEATIAALRATTSSVRIAKTDPRLLERLRAEEAVSAMKAGGEIRTMPADEKSLEETASGIGKVSRWIQRWLDKMSDWFARWWPRERRATDKKVVGVAPRGIVSIIVVAIVVVLGILAFEVVRRSRAATPDAALVTSDPIESRRDEDPLSRGANEWERYAAQLAAAGRTREAIRAWYHAVLVTLYAAGILHFKKGRTNWEYIAALSPELAWRGEFVTMTRRFETEWYGRAQSSADALDDAAGRARRILDVVHRRAA